MNPLPCIGLTGGIGSGKSTAARIFQELGIEVIDADRIAHQITQKNGEAIALIRQHFGEAMLIDGALNRNRMRQTIFTERSAKQTLENILHPIIEKKMLQTVDAAQGAYAILDAPLLFEVPALKNRCQRILVIDCTKKTQMQRILKRNQWDTETINAIIAAQMPRQMRLQWADDVIENEGDLESLQCAIQTQHHFYLNLFKKSF